MNAKEGFWDFSIRVYRSKKLADACLSLQDESGADVNLLLFCCWAAAANVELDGDTFQKALQFSRFWTTDVVRPLRKVRTTMKRSDRKAKTVQAEFYNELRESIKAVELRAEKLQQQELQAMIGTTAPQSDATGPLSSAVSNLCRYCESEAIDLTADTIDRLVVVLAAAFPSENPETARKLFA